MVEKRRSLSWWLLTLPFRPYLRWLTLAVAAALAAGYFTGHTELAGRYLAGRFWPFGTPLIAYAPPDARALALVDMTRPGAGRLRDAALHGQLKARIDALADDLAVSPRWDVLQVMMAWSGTDGAIIAARGRFTPGRIRDSLGSRGYRESQLQGHPLFVRAPDAAVLIRGRSLLLAGSQEAVAQALARVAPQGKGLDESEVFGRWLERVGRRHTCLALAVNPDRQPALGALALGELRDLEALGLIVDTDGEQGLQFAAALGTRTQTELIALQERLSAVAGQLRAGSSVVLSPQLRPLLANLEVRSGDQVAFLQSSASVEQAGRWIETAGDPQQMAGALVSVVAAGAIGGALTGLGSLLPSGAPSTTAAPASAPGVGDAVKSLLNTLVDKEAL
ncbi:MAG: hypothetical protein JXR83_01075 [Deltaproteobacteria bacterium]|nr:hypothetical protein [Deltaproteobacteria bacterium]